MESQPQNPEFRINPENFHPRNSVINDFYLRSSTVLTFSIAAYLVWD